jgi:hypothetical protein
MVITDIIITIYASSVVRLEVSLSGGVCGT